MNYDQYVVENSQALSSVNRAVLADFETALLDARHRNAQIFFFGNGGSAASASHAVGDIVKTAKGARDWGGIRATSLSEMQALFTAYSNDTSFEEAGSGMLTDLAQPKDLLVLISVSGKSPNLVHAARKANEMAMTVLSLVGKNGLELARWSDHTLFIDSEDYQVVENAHMSLIHYFTKVLQTN